jgi:hypothetical protein
LTWLGLAKGRLLALQESAACVTEQKLELNSGSVAGAAGKGRYVGVPTYVWKEYIKIVERCLDFVKRRLNYQWGICILLLGHI